MRKSLLISIASVILILGFVGLALSAPTSGPFGDLSAVINAMNNTLNSLSSAVGNLQADIVSLVFANSALNARVTALENASQQGQLESFFDIFTEISGIPGESEDEKHKGWIDTESFSWGVVQTRISHGGGGAGAGKADFSDFSIVKRLDKASVNLYLACASGEHIPEVKIELCRATGDKQCYMEYKLSDVVVSGCQSSGSGNEVMPSEQVSFNYGKIEWKYTQIDSKTGEKKGEVKGGWDIAENKKV